MRFDYYYELLHNSLHNSVHNGHLWRQAYAVVCDIEILSRLQGCTVKLAPDWSQPSRTAGTAAVCAH